MTHKCIASAFGFPNKIYLWTAHGELKKHYNQEISFKNESKRNDTTLEKFT